MCVCNTYFRFSIFKDYNNISSCMNAGVSPVVLNISEIDAGDHIITIRPLDLDDICSRERRIQVSFAV